MKVDDGCGNILREDVSYVNLYLETQAKLRYRVVVDNEADGSEGVRIYEDNDDEPLLRVDFNHDGSVTTENNLTEPPPAGAF